jgi:hypothetical protein
MLFIHFKAALDVAEGRRCQWKKGFRMQCETFIGFCSYFYKNSGKFRMLTTFLSLIFSQFTVLFLLLFRLQESAVRLTNE